MAHDAAVNWQEITGPLAKRGWAVLPQLLSPAECERLAGVYPREARFRKRVVMARHGYGRGEYQYFDYPLPRLVQRLRAEAYAELAPLANCWQQQLGLPDRFPASHAEYLRVCHDAGQSLPTPLLLSYAAGDFNCLHQDLYGERVFPLQLVVQLCTPGVDFSGGELILTSQRARRQAQAQVVSLQQGDAAIFAVNHWPERGVRGYRRVTMRHGVSELLSGRRLTAGIIFHDAS